MPPPRAVVVECPAKVNLHLRVGPPRADGFHPLLTWMATVGLFDTLTVRAVGSGGDGADDAPPVRLRCEPPTMPADDRNLVFRVLSAWSERVRESGGRFPPIDATLVKRTPVGAGLGGGSSDAACAILAAARLTARPTAGQPAAGAGGGVEPRGEGLSAFAARFGSDVPFFLHAPSAVCTGRGEVVRPVAPSAAKWGVLILPPVMMPTPDVYRRFDAMTLGRDRVMADEPDWAAWARMPAADLLARLANDLEPAAFAIAPELDGLRREAEDVVGRPVRMSGSGSSLFTLFDDGSAARAGRDRLRDALGRRAALAGDAIREVPVGVPIEVRDLE